MNNNFNLKKLITSVFITVLLLYFMVKTPGINSKIILVPFWICSITMVGKQIALFLGKRKLAVVFSKLYIIGFLLFLFGFLSVAVFLCIRDKNYNMLLLTLPFWIVGIHIVKRSLLNNQTNRNGKMPIHIGTVISVISVLVLLVAGIMFLVQGVMKSDMKLLFAGGFFTFGAFTFVIAALTVKGYFERCKVDVLGLYIGILFVVIGVGIITMIYQQKFRLWITFPILMIGAGVVQIIKCIRNEKGE